MAEIHHLAYGWVNPVLAYVMSALGCLLGLLLMTKARARTGRRRVRLLAYAAVAIGGTGIWQMHFIAMLGFDVPATSLRYDPLRTAASLAIAVVVVGGGLFVAGYGRLRIWRPIVAGALVGVGISAMHYTGMAAVRTGGTIEYEPRRFWISIAIAMAVASAALWFTVALKGLRAAVVAAGVMAAAISGMHYTGMSAVRVHLGVDHHAITGIPPIFLIAPIVMLGGATIAMVAFFTFGNSTMQEVRAIYGDQLEESTGVIESRILAEVMARVTSGDSIEPLVLPTTALALAPRAGTVAAPGADPAAVVQGEIVGGVSAGTSRADSLRLAGAFRRPPGPRPTPGIKPVWRSMPVWGRAENDRTDGTPTNHTLTLAPSRYPPRTNPGPADGPKSGKGRNSAWRNRRPN